MRDVGALGAPGTWCLCDSAVQAAGAGKALLARISVGQRKATEGMHFMLRKTSDSPRSEENAKEEIQQWLGLSGERWGFPYQVFPRFTLATRQVEQ